MNQPEDADLTKKLALKFFQRALSLYQYAQTEHTRRSTLTQDSDADGKRLEQEAKDAAAALHYSEEHVSLLLEISKVYKIMSLLQPDNDEGLTKSTSTLQNNNTSTMTSTSPSPSVFPKLRWECL